MLSGAVMLCSATLSGSTVSKKIISISRWALFDIGPTVL